MIAYRSLVPIGENFLVKRLPSNTMTGGGLHIPDQAQEPSMRAELVCVGKGRHDSEPGWLFEGEIEEGDTLLLSRFGGKDLGDDYLIVPPSAILGVFSPHGRLFPIGKQLLVEMDSREEKKGSIVVPEYARGTNVWGVVRRAGEGYIDHVDQECAIFEGKVYITPQQGTHYKEGGKDFIIVHADKVLMWVGSE